MKQFIVIPDCTYIRYSNTFLAWQLTKTTRFSLQCARYSLGGTYRENKNAETLSTLYFYPAKTYNNLQCFKLAVIRGGKTSLRGTRARSPQNCIT